MKRYQFYIKVTICLQLLTSVFHLLNFVENDKPTNKNEEVLYQLMSNYKFDLGAGFHKSMLDLMNTFSISFVLLLFFFSRY